MPLNKQPSQYLFHPELHHQGKGALSAGMVFPDTMDATPPCSLFPGGRRFSGRKKRGNGLALLQRLKSGAYGSFAPGRFHGRLAARPGLSVGKGRNLRIRATSRARNVTGISLSSTSVSLPQYLI
jgi:hypothetical protein